MSTNGGTHNLENVMPSTQEVTTQTDVVPAHKEEHANVPVEGPGAGER